MFGVASARNEVCDFAKGFDADYAFERKVGLEWKPTGKVISAN
jgi:hypothetical protein